MKQEKIVEIFNSISSSYDLVNRVVSFGIDKKWREIAIDEVLKLHKPNKILDIACGTGDMIEIWQKKSKATICGVDPSKGMLEVAKKRFENVKFYEAYATDIPVEDECADTISISFGIRNVVEIEKAIKEFNRVLSKNGIVVVLEFTKSKNKLRKFVDFYTNNILPKIGGMISKHEDAYEYLAKSIENFYTVEELISLFEKQNFKLKTLKSLNFSQVSLIILEKQD